jgi:hypothetical protein
VDSRVVSSDLYLLQDQVNKWARELAEEMKNLAEEMKNLAEEV